jgi:hypothetical protein
MTRTTTDPQIIFTNEIGEVMGYKRSKAYYVGSERTITLSLHTGNGMAVGQKLRVYGSIKTLGNEGIEPVDINEEVTSDNAFAPLLLSNMTDGCSVSGKDGITIKPTSNGMYQVTSRVSYVYFEIEGSGVPVTLLIRTYN